MADGGGRSRSVLLSGWVADEDSGGVSDGGSGMRPGRAAATVSPVEGGMMRGTVVSVLGARFRRVDCGCQRPLRETDSSSVFAGGSAETDA